MITEDLDVFLADFGVSVTAGAVSGVGILDMPGESIMGDMVISSNYQVVCRADEFGNLGYGDQIVADGLTYLVQEMRLISDGRFCALILERVLSFAGFSLVTTGGVRIKTLDGQQLIAA